MSGVTGEEEEKITTKKVREDLRIVGTTKDREKSYPVLEKRKVGVARVLLLRFMRNEKRRGVFLWKHFLPFCLVCLHPRVGFKTSSFFSKKNDAEEEAPLDWAIEVFLKR